MGRLVLMVGALLLAGGASSGYGQAGGLPGIPPAPYELTKLQSRSISPGNPTGEKGAGYRGAVHSGGNLPPGDQATKHCVGGIHSGETFTIGADQGQGMIRSIWLTFPKRTPENLRSYVLRIYWDGSDQPSVLAPIGDFFGLSHGRAAHFSTPYLGVSEGKGFHCFFPMPFSDGFRITIENDSPATLNGLFYQIIYTLGDKVTTDMGRFHAHFRRQTPPKGSNFVMLETKGSPGVYVGAVISALPIAKGTWREGDIRFFIDGDQDRPTIVGTGWSDWFLSGWGLGIHQSLYAGSNYQVLHPELKNKYFCNSFRFHVMDPIYFQRDLRVEYTQVGEPRDNGTFSERSDDWSATVYWYQRITGMPLASLPPRAERIRGLAVPDWEADAEQPLGKGTHR